MADQRDQDVIKQEPMVEESESEDREEVSWIEWWLTRSGNDFLCEVSESFIQDNFNLTGLQNEVRHMRRALDIILDIEFDGSDESSEDELEKEAQKLYGLIHARFIVSPRGLARMVEKYNNGDFGQCPRVMCERINMLPVGMSDNYGKGMAKSFCPNCKDIYNTKIKNDLVDGSFIGTSFPHVALLTFPELSPAGAGNFDKLSATTMNTYSVSNSGAVDTSRVMHSCSTVCSVLQNRGNAGRQLTRTLTL
ncbi:hypothetical protein SARC_08546 [Sphaeroforma arctica JP610]|uniref:Casein kinase II subunit beta n=1 Tax=Sphaeroforma arctica JP610 TaxID=667725 RepID=A0A0L0FSV8_9EUKA|nr:hypothetical protein SARC_08546 [Sphaeroforma arctica JP610]KNC79048.1 hypothetical protein SARC_08546 [Sphaeroforma arctica JP610]|eukprot:XP_014152950.1 hypothetical protein SARC_08546 [Sphaeroforma arctica JP610]